MKTLSMVVDKNEFLKLYEIICHVCGTPGSQDRHPIHRWEYMMDTWIGGSKDYCLVFEGGEIDELIWVARRYVEYFGYPFETLSFGIIHDILNLDDTFRTSQYFGYCQPTTSTVWSNISGTSTVWSNISGTSTSYFGAV